MRAVAIGCLIGFAAVAAMPQARAETPQSQPQSGAHVETPADIVKRIIEEMKTHPPMSTGDHVVGEQLC